MSRPLRIEYPGAVYHITTRGNGRMAIFGDDADRERFLEIVKDVTKRFNWLCHTYCLMGNHYHLLVETIDGNLSAGMRQVNGVYTQYYNRRHDKVGHVFQGRFKAILVEKESYLLELCRYVVLNPVRARIVKEAKEHEWSSYRSIAGIDKQATFLTTDWILSQFGEDRKRAQRNYRKFIADGIGMDPIEDVKSQCILGSDKFFERLSLLLGDITKLKEIPRMQRYVSRPSLDELFRGEALLRKGKRNELLKRAHEQYGYSYSEIGRHVGLHYATISRLIRK
jgi:REP element-mobilizing transposase RayT